MNQTARRPLSVRRARVWQTRGQFIPITALVTLTTTAFLVAVYDVYTVSRAKMKVQNLADAAALNVATQMVASVNKMADLNEWMNHMTSLAPGQTPANSATGINCSGLPPKMVPPISCVESTKGAPGPWLFDSKPDAQVYAKLVKSVNDAQKLFASTYDGFIGATNQGAISNTSPASLQQILFKDIPDLDRADTKVKVWNDVSGDNDVQNWLQQVDGNLKQLPAGAGSLGPGSVNVSHMRGLSPALVTKDLSVGYKETKAVKWNTLGNLLGPAGSKIGWMYFDFNSLPSLKVQKKSGGANRVGAGVCVARSVVLPVLGSQTVSACSKAFIVEGSGNIGNTQPGRFNDSDNFGHPKFVPTYWVKLAGVN